VPPQLPVDYTAYMIELFSRFIPLLLIIGLGAVLRHFAVLNDTSIAGIKKLIINVGLPSVFFVSFTSMEIAATDVLVYLTVFVFCLLLFAAGALAKRIGILPYPLSEFYMTGFEFGMVGVALFGSIFGLENMPAILLFGLGHEFFIWFVYAPLLNSQNHGTVDLMGILKSFIRSPIIISILTALILNLSGAFEAVSDFRIVGGVMATFSQLSSLVAPLILITIGYGLHFTEADWGAGLRLIGIRLVIVAILALPFFLVLQAIGVALEGIMLAALVTFLILPPPYIIPVFMGERFERERITYNNSLLLYTLVSILLFMIAVAIIG
jgi:predicted permease